VIFVIVIADDPPFIDGVTFPLRVLVPNEIKPFVQTDINGNLIGFSVDIWTRIAEYNQWTYEYVVADTNMPHKLIAQLKNGSVDLIVSAISKTSHGEEGIDFSQEIMTASVGVMIHRRQRPLLPVSVTSLQFWTTIASFILLLFIVAHLFWWFEGGRHIFFADDYFSGVWLALWWTSVTVTTVGYGDIVPKSRGGFIVAVCWMFSGIIIISLTSGSIATTLTVNSLSFRPVVTLAELKGFRNIGTIELSTSEYFLRRNGVTNIITALTVSELEAQLSNRTIDAVVFDYNILSFHAAESDNFVLARNSLFRQDYGIVLPQESPLRENIDRAILQLQEIGYQAEAENRWFGQDRLKPLNNWLNTKLQPFQIILFLVAVTLISTHLVGALVWTFSRKRKPDDPFSDWADKILTSKTELEEFKNSLEALVAAHKKTRGN